MTPSQTHAVRPGSAPGRMPGVAGLIAAFGISVAAWCALIAAAILLIG